jgi:hypothetical protein
MENDAIIVNWDRQYAGTFLVPNIPKLKKLLNASEQPMY